MLKMDGCAVQPGDCVFDVTRGQGTVHMVRPDGLDVEFRASDVRSYNSNFSNASAPLRQLFWHNPIVYTPPKDTCANQLIQRGLRAIATSVRCGA